MPIYLYTGTDRNGSNTKGDIEADTIKAARQKLKKNGVLLLSIVEKSVKKNQSSFTNELLGRKNVPFKFVAQTTRQLASLVRANIPLVDALTAVIDQTEHPALKMILSDIRQNVNEGSSFHKALSKHPKVFTQIYRNLVESGEATGTLHIVLVRLADFAEGQIRLKGKIISAVTYPLLMLGVGAMLMLGIFTFVIPKIAGIISSMNKTLPWYTELLMNISFFVRSYWWTLIIGFIGSSYLLRKFISTPSGREKADRLLLKAPIFGDLVRMIAISRFASTLSTLLNGGVQIIGALNIVKNVVNNKVLEKAISDAQENIVEGQSISEPLRKSGQFPKLLIHMISIGERTGELSQMLESVAENYEEQVDRKIEQLTSLLEPIMIIIMGLCVGVIVMAVIVPLLDLQQMR